MLGGGKDIRPRSGRMGHGIHGTGMAVVGKIRRNSPFIAPRLKRQDRLFSKDLSDPPHEGTIMSEVRVYDAPSDLVGRWVREADMQALRAENARLRKALQLIVHGTQDEAPPWRCLGVTQMQAIARDAVQPERGKP